MRAKRVKVEVPSGRFILLFALVVIVAAYFLVPNVITANFNDMKLGRVFSASYVEMAFSLAYFLILSYLTGYSLTKDFFKEDDFIESASMRLGFGVASLPFIFVLIETAHAPLRWYFPLAISAIRPAYDLFTGDDFPKISRKSLLRLSPDLSSSIAVLIFALAFCLALFGSYRYPYLEDGDSWEHAVGVKYVSEFGTYTPPAGVFVAHYLKPYPPAYDTLLGLIKQLNSSVNWTLKAFNSILVGLTYLFAFFLVRRATGEPKTAIFATAILFMMPSFGSHAIWAQTLSALALFPTFYAVERIGEDKSWAILAIILLASSLLIQPLMSVVMGVFYLIFLVARSYANKREAKTLIAVGIISLSLSMVYWLPIFSEAKSQKSEMTGYVEQLLGGNTRVLADQSNLPTMMQVLFPASHGDIFMQPGLGLFAVILAILFIDLALRQNLLNFAKKNTFLSATFGWLILSFIALLSGNLSFSLDPARFWGIVAVPLAILSGYMLAHIGDLRWVPKKHVTYVTAFFVAGLAFTSLYPKVNAQMSIWPTDLEAKLGANFVDYLRVLGVPQTTAVYTYCLPDKFIIGLDRQSLPWDQDIVDSRSAGYNIDPSKLHTLLKDRGYDWALFDSSCVRQCEEENNNSTACILGYAQALKNLDDSKLFTTSWKTDAIRAFHVN